MSITSMEDLKNKQAEVKKNLDGYTCRVLVCSGTGTDENTAGIAIKILLNLSLFVFQIFHTGYTHTLSPLNSFKSSTAFSGVIFG